MRRYPSVPDNSAPFGDRRTRPAVSNLSFTAAYSPLTLNDNTGRTSRRPTNQVMQRYESQLHQTAYRDYSENEERRNHSSSPTRSIHFPDSRHKNTREGILYDYFDSKPLTRDIYNNQPQPGSPRQTSEPSTKDSSGPLQHSFEDRAKELEKKLPRLYPPRKKGQITFQDELPSVQTKYQRSVRHPINTGSSKARRKPHYTFVKATSGGLSAQTQFVSMRQPLIGSADSIDDTYNDDDEYPRRRTAASPIGNRRPTSKRSDDDVMGYLRENKKKTIIDKDDEDVESQDFRRHSIVSLGRNHTLCGRLRHGWRVLSDVRGKTYLRF